MIYKEFTKNDIAQAANLLSDRNKEERKVFPSLEQYFYDSAQTTKILEDKLNTEKSIGMCAYEDNQLKGFILSELRKNSYFEKHAWVAYDSHAVKFGHSQYLYRELYTEISKKWIEEEVYNHYVMIPTGSKNAWLNLGFAFQQVYGISEITQKTLNSSGQFVIRRATQNDRESLADISSLIMTYQTKSPTYAMAYSEDLVALKEGYQGLTDDPDAILYLAFENDKLVGYCCGFINESASMMHPSNSIELAVSGVIDGYRGLGIGSLLFNTLQNHAYSLGLETMITDWRITNPTSSSMWPKRGFQPFAYRMVRKVDQRINSALTTRE